MRPTFTHHSHHGLGGYSKLITGLIAAASINMLRQLSGVRQVLVYKWAISHQPFLFAKFFVAWQNSFWAARPASQFPFYVLYIKKTKQKNNNINDIDQ